MIDIPLVNFQIFTHSVRTLMWDLQTVHYLGDWWEDQHKGGRAGQSWRKSFQFLGWVSKHKILYKEKYKKWVVKTERDRETSQYHWGGGLPFPTMTPPPPPQLTVTTSNTGQTGIDLRLRGVGQLFKSGAVSKSDRVKQLVISHSGGVKLGGRPVMVRCRRFWLMTITYGAIRATS